MSFETKWIAFLAQNSAASSLIHILPQTQCGMLMKHYHSTTAQYRLCNDRTFSMNMNIDNTSIPTEWVLFLPYVAKRQEG